MFGWAKPCSTDFMFMFLSLLVDIITYCCFFLFRLKKNVKSDSAAAMFSFSSVVFHWLDRNSNFRNGRSLTLQFSRSDTVFLHMNNSVSLL